MGVEYAHYLLAKDPMWTAGLETARRVHSVLQAWGLVVEEPTVFELVGGKERKLQGKLTTLSSAPANLLVRYAFVTDVPAIATIMGPSYYTQENIGPRYFQGISVVVGTDFRIGPSDEQRFIEVTQPPIHKSRIVAAHTTPDHLWEFDDSYPADAATTPPMTQLDPPERFPKGFTGAWRAGVMLDCGKDLPLIEEARPLSVHSRFLLEMEAAFGTRLVQIGRIY